VCRPLPKLTKNPKPLSEQNLPFGHHDDCLGNSKYNEAMRLLGECGLSDVKEWASDGMIQRITCVEKDMGMAITTLGALSTFTVACKYNAGDVAMQIVGEYWRQKEDVTVVAQTARLNRLWACVAAKGQRPNARWSHREECDQHPGMISDARRACY
jgi:hypothetical protein